MRCAGERRLQSRCPGPGPGSVTYHHFGPIPESSVSQFPCLWKGFITAPISQLWHKNDRRQTVIK